MEIKELQKDGKVEEFIEFLHQHLDQYGDSKEDIGKCIDYAFSDAEGKGGFALAGFEDGKLVAALVMNDTGMNGYIPENILVYVAVHKDMRGKGLGGQIIEAALKRAEGKCALHVEYENPAKRLYERLGFKSKYAEMRK